MEEELKFKPDRDWTAEHVTEVFIENEDETTTLSLNWGNTILHLYHDDNEKYNHFTYEDEEKKLYAYFFEDLGDDLEQLLTNRRYMIQLSPVPSSGLVELRRNQRIIETFTQELDKIVGIEFLGGEQSA